MWHFGFLETLIFLLKALGRLVWHSFKYFCIYPLVHLADHLADHGLHYIQYVFFSYCLFLVAYNCFRALLKRHPLGWPRRFFRWLLVLPRRSRWYLVRLWRLGPPLVLRLGQQFLRELHYLGLRALRHGRWSWWALVAYGQEASAALGWLWRCWDFFAFLRDFRWEHLVAALRATARGLWLVYGRALRDHGIFIGHSALGFVQRPLVHRWTLFRFLKHLLGIASGISFFFYVFLWCSYVCYVFCHGFFLAIDILCFSFLRPLLVRHEAFWAAFLEAYDKVIVPPREFLLEGLFTAFPARVKETKDGIFASGRELFRRRVLRPALWHCRRRLWIWFYSGHHFVTITAYFQTRYFVRLLVRLLVRLWTLYKRLRGALGRLWKKRQQLRENLRLRVLLGHGLALPGRLVTFLRTYRWGRFFFFLRDCGRWFSFVLRRYIFLGRWRKRQHRWRKRWVRLGFKLRGWAPYAKLLVPGVLAGALLAVFFFLGFW